MVRTWLQIFRPSTFLYLLESFSFLVTKQLKSNLLLGLRARYRKETHSSASGLRLRSTEKCDLQVRRMKTRFGDRAFSAAGPRCWNRLPAALRTAGSIDSFKTGLKTYLFSISYPGC